MKGGNHNFKEAQTTVEFLLGPIKIKDGLFLGDQFAAKDIQFIISNKVTHVINTVSKTIPNLYQRFGIQYLSVHWTEREQNIFDKKNNAVNAIFEFVEEAMAEGESCLIHSVFGKSRSCAVLIAYLMKKYHWSLNKSLELVKSKKEGLEIRNNYMVQMQELEKRMRNQLKLSNNWSEIKNEEDLTLANTFANSKKTEVKFTPHPKNQNKKVAWAEKLIQKPSNQRDNFTHTLGFSQEKNNHPNTKPIRSILKGDQENEQDSQIKQQKEQIHQNSAEKMSATFSGSNVTVNNFLQSSEKKKQHETSSKIYNTRPFSSDQKDRQRRGIVGKMLPSDSMVNTYKNPYERHLMGKMPGTRAQKKKDEQKNLMMIYDRPFSAKTTDDRRKSGRTVVNNPIADKLGFNLLPTNKKKYPFGANRDESNKWK